MFGRSTTLEPDTTTATANVVDDDVVKSAGGVITTETQMTFDNQFSESPRSAPLLREPNNKVRH